MRRRARHKQDRSHVLQFSVLCQTEEAAGVNRVLPVQAQEKSSETKLGLGKEGALGTVFPRFTLASDLE